jgi:aliphatic nitrilase
MIAYAKSAADPVGHYSRPDVVRLMFNSNPNPVVMPFSGEHSVVSSASERDRIDEEKENCDVSQQPPKP